MPTEQNAPALFAAIKTVRVVHDPAVSEAAKSVGRFRTLYQLSYFLNSNPDVRVEIAVSAGMEVTDPVDTAQQQADALASYLGEKGVDSARISAIGLEPSASNKSGNSRVELRLAPAE